jgi:hypothetical protein
MSTPSDPLVETIAPVWRLKKAEDDNIFGPVDESVLKAWADSAQIAPQDMVDKSDDNWQPAHAIPQLEMVWEVPLGDNKKYGPTTAGTLREFFQEGLLDETTEAHQVKTGEVKTIATLLGISPHAALPPREVKAPLDEALADSPNSRSGRILVEMAKSQRIRQMEEDMQALRREHEELLAKYRKLNQELRSGKSGSS